MHSLPRIQDLSTEEIARLLEQQGQEVPATLLPDLKVLIHEISGLQDDGKTDRVSGPLNKAA
ncbi:MAG: hypothetical protein GX575_02815 [Candidatus Anammoximicrobium sp.]|nr:hypothetical protein [Candidatus Anammoximicrobium sp.]